MLGRDVRVRLAPKAERELIEGLMQFYLYDFSEMEPERSAALEFDARGHLAPYRYLPDYWREEGRRPLLIRVGGKPAGFALVNTRSNLGGPVDHNMAEFFVARKHRRRGVATEAVRQTLTLYPGSWEVAALDRNAAAKAFWPRAIAATPQVDQFVEHRGEATDWDGPIWSFVVRSVLEK